MSTKYNKRRRNAFLAALVLALLVILIIVLIIVGIKNRNKKPTPKPTATPTATLNPDIPSFAPSETEEPYLPTPGDETPVPGDETPTPTAGTVTATPTTGTVTATPDVSTGKTMYVTGEGVNVRKTASATGDVVTSCAKGTQVTAFEENNGWTRIKLANNTYGYMKSSFLSATKPGNATPTATATATTAPSLTPDTTKQKTMYVSGDSVNVRDKASSDGSAITRLTKDAKITAYQTSGDWTYIQYASGKYGWIASKYLADHPSTVPVTPTATATSAVTPTPTATAAVTPTATPTATPTPTPTPTPTATPVPYASKWADISGLPQSVWKNIDAAPKTQADYLEVTTKNQTVTAKALGDWTYYKIAKLDGKYYYLAGKTGVEDAPYSIYDSLDDIG